ncbi:osmotically inducible protein C [Nonlabens sp. YIK11]|uniref:bifunctional alpha/beta hydrolase/OsmC family protein n=1 Tax=Nonlabens sp. YIK11 TaxID=1453349 RepID=UPI0006DC2BA8|nr:bifunctional alpha/beta hydrolase/OsmC family protein [Nonlabens sp. YIK11]KQC33443.1 osmotically inducible protein C [Nonlabens sp. YIK11]
MKMEKITFQNADGYELSGRLELPIDQKPHNYAVFAHCFTCSKNFTATRNITRALTSSGFGVLRFDFTGLGDSDGDFGDTNFSGNVEDLLAAIDYLSTHHKAPSLAIGHSLGGAAIIFASAKAESIQAVATIGTPSDTKHVKHLFGDQIEAIIENGEAVVELSGRPFKIKEQFLRDVDEQMLTQTLKDMRKPLLICHSPQDNTVGIQHAERLYHAAIHPKSFLSLDGADHLLTNKEDSHYVGNVIAGWASRYLELPEIKTIKSQHEIAASLNAADGFTTQVKAGNHYLTVDEPLEIKGNDYGPTPYDLLSSGLASCTVMTIQMYSKRKKWHVEDVECHVTYDKQHAADCENCEDNSSKIDTFTRHIKFPEELEDHQIKKLLEIADKCPVHRTLHSKTQVITHLL